MVDEEKIRAEIRKIEFCNISDEKIIADIGMADMPLLSYLMTIKYKTNPQIIPIENDLMIRIGECNLANFSYLAVTLHFLKIVGNKLILEGLTSNPAQIEGVSFGVRINGKVAQLNVDDSDFFDQSYEGNVYEYRRRFRVEIPLEDSLEISFFNSYKSINVDYGRINSMRFSPIADVISGQYYYKHGYIFYINGNKIVCRKINDIELNSYEINYRNVIKENYPDKYKWVTKLRDFYINNKNDKPVFLIMDRADEADDNARVFWEYLIENKKNVDAYFVLSSKVKDFKKLKRKGNVVPLYSEWHYKLALTADFIISSQCNGVIENPFWNDCEFFRDIYHRPKMIFLQHGVIKDDMSLTLNRFNTNFTGFLTSTYEEWQSIVEYPYFYSESDVWNIGLPRFDRLVDKKEKIILIMPTWRKELMTQSWSVKDNNMHWELADDYKASDFYKKYKSLLENSRLKRICRQYGYKMVFLPHPLIKKMYDKRIYKFFSRRGKSYNAWFRKGALLITDYSSVAFDFLYLKKPVIYYQFDKEKFFETHTYKKGYFDYEAEKYGKVVSDENELIDLIEQYLESDCAIEEPYNANIEELFVRNNTHCEVLYNKIMSYI